jgi:hypothetical protein
VHPDTGDIGDITTPRLEIGFIAIKCPAQCNGLTVVTIAISANTRDDTSAVLSLPEIEGIIAVGLFKIVCVTDCLSPIAPFPSATRKTQVPAVWLRRYPRPTRGPIFANTGFLATGSFSRAARVSSFLALALRAMLSVPVVSWRRA